MSEQTNSGEKKPKRAKSQSMIMCSEQLKQHYADAWAAKERGEPIGWSTSIFPQEIPETLGLQVLYPENHSAGLAARHVSDKFLQHAEGPLEYNNDLCAYAKTNLAYLDILDAPSDNMPPPDFVLVCNNICNQVAHWFENIAKKRNIPLFWIDTVFNHESEFTDSRQKYIRQQIDDCIRDLSAFTGRKFDEKKFQEVMDISAVNRDLWIEANELLAHEPSPLNGFELFNYMSTVVCCRGKQSTSDILTQLVKEIKEHIANGTSTFPVEQQYRLYWDGIACWPHLSHNLSIMKNYGMNVVATNYVTAWALDYESGDLDGMAKAYSYSTGNNVNLDVLLERRAKIYTDFNVDGALYHMNRSCKVMDCQQYELQRRLTEMTGVPFASFDGDQADYRNYSEAQFETRLEAFAEVMKTRKEAKRNGKA